MPYIRIFVLMKSDPRQVSVEMPSVSGKFPLAGWRCKAWTYVNHDLDNEKSWIYFAKDPKSKAILVNFFSKGSCSDWHSVLMFLNVLMPFFIM